MQSLCNGWRRVRWRRTRALSTFVVHGELTQLPKGTIPQVGVTASLVHTFHLEDTIQFATLNGDNNPIHTTVSADGQPPIVQGMLTSSLFATIFGRTIPGALYISQELRWRSPLYIEETVCARIRVIKTRKRFVECETLCEKTVEGITRIVVEGKATVLIPS